ncbi:hypothetical protein D9611_004619 [Ephemerocybe angulata]|uniref:EF-hand domain-containing protein n=1 Tax=Ephemerocybe angulata TaxID=980116 RepID=A0A8H5B3B8_9AGAR|nr:hypothetical protein D9611_004619 [Tulosesus angulatus]
MPREMDDFETAAMQEVFARMSEPRPDTPEPSSRQGRRNGSSSGVQLLDNEGGVTAELEACLKHIFAKYCTPSGKRELSSSTSSNRSTGEASLLTPPPGAYFTGEALDEWAKDTNGAPFSQETKDELIEFLDVTDEGCLTFKGFLQIYQLQTENDEEETWRDLSSHGFDRSLQLVYTRREDADTEDMDMDQATSS